MGAEQPTADDLDNAVQDVLKRAGTPGCAIGLLQQATSITRGYGVANIETNLPVTPGTLFQLASISKVLTATLVMMLVDDGSLDLDAPVTTYLPDLAFSDPSVREQITQRRLLSHTSGLYGDYFGEFGPGDDTLQRAVAGLRDVPQRTRPGELWAYGNSGYVLAGAVIARVLGMTFESAMQERLLAPLGLTRTFYFAEQAIAYPVAVGHNPAGTASDVIEVARRYAIPRFGAPAGGAISTVEDLLRLARFHFGDGILLQPDTLQEMQRAQTTAANFANSWGLGWDLRTIDGVEMLGHSGGSNGFSTRLTFVPSQAFALAILANGGDPVLDIERWALARYCGLQIHPPQPIALGLAELERFKGLYRSPQDTLRVSVYDGLRVDMRLRRLLAHAGREFSPPPLLLRPISEREFIVSHGEDADQRIDFQLGDDGRPRFIRYGGRIADRVDESEDHDRPAT